MARISRLKLALGGLAITGALVAGAGSPAGAQELPSASCNQGTMHAHESVPETTGNGTPVSAHERIPDSDTGPCSHSTGQ